MRPTHSDHALDERANRIGLTILLICAGMLMPGWKLLAAEKHTPHLTVQLTDGSRLIGSTTLAALPVKSAALGTTIQIPLVKIRAIKCGEPAGAVVVSLTNGDRVQGSRGDVTLKLRTLFGVVTIPWDKTEEIQFRSGATEAVWEGLVAHFPFAGNAEDQSEQKHEARVVGATFAADDDVGRKVLRVAGNTSSYVVIPRSAALEPTEGLTISVWIKGVPGQAAGHGWGTLLRKSNNCQPGYFFRGGGVTNFDVEGENPCGIKRTLSLGFRPFDEHRWQHLVATYSREEGRARTYQDGKLVEEKATTARLYHSGDLHIGGASAASDDGGFRGSISDLRIYNRALTEAEIEALAAAPPFSPAAGP